MSTRNAYIDDMRFEEAVSTLQQRPGHVAWLPGRMVLRLSGGGMLRNIEHNQSRAAPLRASDVLAVLWEVWTPSQLEEQIAQRTEAA
jgi:hypothetical protein